MIIKKIVFVLLLSNTQLKADGWDDRIAPLTCGMIEALESGIRKTGQQTCPCCKKCGCHIPYSYCAGSGCGVGCISLGLIAVSEILTWPCRWFMVTSPSE